MDPSCKSLAKEDQENLRDLMDDSEEDSGISHTPPALHILDLPDSVIFQVFVYLPFSSIGATAQVCTRFRRISSDELLWRHVFLQHYKLSANTVMPAKARSWSQEFKRLYYHTPAVLSEERKEHKDEVLHVSFSHDGTMFATCSKDGFFKIWECTHPVRLLFMMDMKSTFSWKFTQFSQFNETDTCLLVSGVYFGRLSTSGEIAVFNLEDDFRMQCRVTNKPYDVFGAWYDNDHLLSGTLYWTGDFNSVSAVWLSKASQEVESEVESVSMVLYRFENVNSSSIRLLHVAEVDRDTDTTESILDKEETSESGQTSPHSSSLGLGDEGKVNVDFDSAKSRSEVDGNGPVQEKAPVEEPCILDMLLQRYITEDEFDIENEDKTDDDGEDEGFQMECESSKEHGLPNEVADLDKGTYLNKKTCDFNDTDNVDKSSEASSSDLCFLPPKVVSIQNDACKSNLNGAASDKVLLSKSPETFRFNTELDKAQVSSDSQLIDRISADVHNFNPGFYNFPEKHLSKYLPSTEPAIFKIPQCTAMTGSKISKQNTSTSGGTSSKEPKDNFFALSAPSSLNNSFFVNSNSTDNAKSSAQEIQPVTTASDSLLSESSLFPLLDFLTDKTDMTTTSASSVRIKNNDLTRSNDTTYSSSQINADCLPESTMEYATDNFGVQEDNLSMDGVEPASDKFSFCDGALSLTSIPHDNFQDGRLSDASFTQNNFNDGRLASASINHDNSHDGVLSDTSRTHKHFHDGTLSGASITHDNFRSWRLSGASITSNTFNNRALSDGSITPESVCADACLNARESSQLSIHPKPVMTDNLEGASGCVNEHNDSDTISENKPGARDVSQQFGLGLGGSRDISYLNVPSIYDNNNLVMLIPGTSYVYGNRNFNSANHNVNINNNNINNNNAASSEIESSSGLESDALSADVVSSDAGPQLSHKSSIATQTEVASSRASSFHSLSHMSQSSSISRDFQCSPPREKLLIYTWGSETYIPHKVGIKRMKWTDFTKGEVTARRSSMLLPDVMENLHNMAGNRRDKPDVTIEMHGHIVGLSLSPDHKYLYVNCRPWPKNYIISDPQDSPPLAQEVEISTIDLTTFNFVGPVLRSHKAYTHSDECFFLNLDVSDDYVASGAEDRQGYLWDRHYGIPLYRFPHRNVVNCVAINPQDSEILVTVSDDYTFKVWMSRCRASELTGSSDANKGTSV